MSEARKEYYDWMKLHELCGHSLSKNVVNYVTELEQQKAELINILKSIAKMKENDENELSRIAKEIIDILEKYK